MVAPESLVSTQVAASLDQASWIRRMFEKGNELRAKLGPRNVFDLSLGNPVIEPPAAFFNTLAELSRKRTGGHHRYMSNAGLLELRAKVAANLTRRKILPCQPEDVVMTVGAGGALNVLMKAILNPGDEVVIMAPYFVEYLFYIRNHGGKPVIANLDKQFDLDLKAIRKALSRRTKAVIVCSPGNPTGVALSKSRIAGLHRLLMAHGRRYGTRVLLVSDEPYREIYYGRGHTPSCTAGYRDSAVVYSWSKSLSIPGDRIGYLALNKTIGEPTLRSAITFTNRTLGFVNAPATMQYVAMKLLDLPAPVAPYRKLRDLLVKGLRDLGIECPTPNGAFYAFPKVPKKFRDDIAFVEAAQQVGVLVVPGRGFGSPGHFRISYAVEPWVLKGALKALKQIV
ncbi:MAG: pyridoxal phosphate-dependent aminotransferase [Planctomycetota bacterium]